MITLLAILAVLMLWPAGEPTNGAWFWTCVTLFPSGIAAFVVSRRYSVYEGRRLDAQAWNDARERHNTQAFARESIPVLVLGAAIRVTENDAENDVQHIMDRSLMPAAQASPHEENESIVTRWLQPVEARLASDDAERHEFILDWLYGCLLKDLSDAIGALPPDLPLRVVIDLSGYRGGVDPVAIWQGRWTGLDMRIAHAERAAEQLDTMALDAWLDDRVNLLSKTALLLISVSLSQVIEGTPLEGTAEAGVGLLLASTALRREYKLAPIAAIHRPVRADNDRVDHALTNALRWGGAEPKSLENVWTTGFDGESGGPLNSALSQAGTTSGQEIESKACDLDLTVGHTGPSAGWLAAACAVHWTNQSAASQLIVQHHFDHTVAAVVVAAHNESMKSSTGA
ncbi:hypothetical protein [Ralstonia sp. UBA689]|uniref:hypothetical protein n=1 Tax=Ralstonia sp. UBA689 TaxID=1947373 RepID=UPI002601104E|nr:hypothetical protein [Ralstonia sp. UBA689]